jgi:hypothetical protein
MQYLVVAATRAEAAHIPGSLDLVVSGIGKTAAARSRVLQALDPGSIPASPPR